MMTLLKNLFSREGASANASALAEAREAGRRDAAQEFARSLSLNGQTMVPGGVLAGGNSTGRPLYGYDRPLWQATPASPKRKPGSIVDVDTLKRFSESYDPLRSCINHLKREVTAQPFRIVARDTSDGSSATLDRIRQASLFFSRHGGLGERNQTRRHYESLIFEDAMVVGAYAVWKSRTKGGQLLQCLPIDASTIRPRMDAYGWPGPGEDWYEQWIQGMLVTGFKPDEITYDGLWPSTDSPYFKSPIEYLVAVVLTALKSDEWNRVWLTDGNTPGKMLSMPETWTPGEIIEYMDYFNAMLAGDTSARNRIIPVPGGVKGADGHSRKDQDFQEFDMWLLRRTCSIMGVQPASIGYAGEQYKVSQDASHGATTQFGAGVLLEMRKEHYDDILYDLGFDDLEVLNGASANEDPQSRANRLKIAVGKPWLTINEGRAQDGQEPVEGGDVLGEATAKPLETDEAEDIARWQRKALKRLKDGKTPACEFRSELIPVDTAALVAEALRAARTDADIKAIFAPYL